MLMKIHVEGHTEEGFVKRILAPHLSKLGYQIIAVKNETSRGHKGGIRKYSLFKRNTLHLCGSSECLITTMIDFYHLPNDFPGYDEISSITNDIDKVKHLEEKLKEDLKIQPPNYFIPYIQLHEFEALLFSDINKIDEVLQDYGCSNHERLKEIIAEYHEPENINTNEGPSVKLINLTDNGYKKITHGLNIAEKIGFEEMRKQCPHFDEWLKQIEKFAKEHCK